MIVQNALEIQMAMFVQIACYEVWCKGEKTRCVARCLQANASVTV